MSSNLYPAQNNSMTTQSINSNSSSYFELESQIVLRMPLVKGENGIKKLHPSATALREALVNKFANMNETAGDEQPLGDEIKDRLSIELNTETRKGRIKFDDEIFEARLVDLPCIIESLKTTDKKMFYKTADICQMLVCRTQDDPWNSSDEEMLKNDSNKKCSKAKKESDKNNALNKYKWPHGLAPPLKNVRRKRFRKVAKKKIIDYAEIEKEVKQIFRADRDAYKIDYEVLLVDGELDDETNDENKNSDRNNSLNNEDEYEEGSSQEDIGATMLQDGNSCIDSALDNDSKIGMKPLKRTILKASNLIDESNISFVDDNSMSAAPTPLTKSKLPEIDAEEDGENTNLSMDNSNLSDNQICEKSNDKNQRTGFKDCFKDVLGDLSSSDEDENNDEDDEDEKMSNDEKVVKSFKFNLNKNSIHMTSKINDNKDTFVTAEESMSNFGEDSNLGFVNASESDHSNLDAHTKFNNENQHQNINKTKNLDILDPSSRTDGDAFSDNDISLEAAHSIKKVNKPNNDFDFSDLSSSLDSTQNNENNAKNIELNAKLMNLEDELQKIKDDRCKRENEIKNINNPGLKALLTSKMNVLIDEENRKQAEIDDIKTELNE